MSNFRPSRSLLHSKQDSKNDSQAASILLLEKNKIPRRWRDRTEHTVFYHAMQTVRLPIYPKIELVSSQERFWIYVDDRLACFQGL
ncbi:hypothetical protein ACKFKF_14490 [Phormidesmis sp. 146-12]